VAIKQAIDQMQITGSAAAGAHGQHPGQMRLPSGSESCNLLVPDRHPFDPVLPAHGISKAIEAVADDSVDPLHTRSGKYLDKLLGDGLGHWRLSFSRAPLQAARLRESWAAISGKSLTAAWKGLENSYVGCCVRFRAGLSWKELKFSEPHL
jgi:hypothetical protein